MRWQSLAVTPPVWIISYRLCSSRPRATYLPILARDDIYALLSFPPQDPEGSLYSLCQTANTESGKQLCRYSNKYFIKMNQSIALFEFYRTISFSSGGFPGGSDGKESACSARDMGAIPGSGRSPGKGNGYPLQYSRLENSMDRRAWWARVLGVTKIRT